MDTTAQKATSHIVPRCPGDNVTIYRYKPKKNIQFRFKSVPCSLLSRMHEGCVRGNSRHPHNHIYAIIYEHSSANTRSVSALKCHTSDYTSTPEVNNPYTPRQAMPWKHRGVPTDKVACSWNETDQKFPRSPMCGLRKLAHISRFCGLEDSEMESLESRTWIENGAH